METAKYQIGDTVHLQTVDERFKDKDLRVDRVNASTNDIEVINEAGDRMWVNWDLVTPVRNEIRNLMNGEAEQS